MAEKSKTNTKNFDTVIKDINNYHGKIKQYGLKVHHSYLKDLPFLLKLLIALFGDFIDGGLGFVPGLNMIGTIFASFLAYALWGDIGFVALWEFVPELIGSLGAIAHPISVVISFIPSIFFIGVFGGRPSQVHLRASQQGVQQTNKGTKRVAQPSKKLDPKIKEVFSRIGNRLGYSEESVSHTYRLHPAITDFWDKIKPKHK